MTPWYETLASVLVGGLLVALPATLAIHFENLRQLASSKDSHNQQLAGFIRSAVAPILKSAMSIRITINSHFESDGPGQPRKQEVIEFSAISAFEARQFSGVLRADPLTSEFYMKYKEIAELWNGFIKSAVEHPWKSSQDESYRAFSKKVDTLVDDLISDIHSTLVRLTTPTPIRNSRRRTRSF